MHVIQQIVKYSTNFILFITYHSFPKSYNSAFDHNINRLKKSRKLNLPIDLQIELFDTMVAPVLLYGCEVWGSENNDIFFNPFYSFIK
jgi:hypothetical protein